MLGLLWVLLQAPPAGPLVGDTVWIDREVRAPAGSLLRPLPWDPGPVASVLGSPQVEVRTDGWLLRYPVVFWQVGRHRLEVPGPLVIRADGRTDSLPPRTVDVEIASVVPAGGAARDTVTPRPAAELLPTGEQTLQPVVILVLLAAIGLVPLHWWWRRRGPAPVRPSHAVRREVLPDTAVLAGWERLGEWRLVADTWIARLEAGGRGEAGERLLAALREARFGTGDPAVLERLCREAAAL